ncbi:HI1506-related protein [Pseudomonas sp. MBLB4136]|uniref:HI1506-related protein n=1 Tax=Pseudomonas sp. MBLB4136 TaxID=3451558 RepID=UPI003F74F055
MAKATTRAAAKPAAAKPAAQKRAAESELLDGIFVRSLPATFRRAGFTFTREGVGLLLADLSPQQLDAIEAEPMLSVTQAQFPATAEADARLAELAKAQAAASDANDDANKPPADDGAGDNPAPENQEGNA